MTEQRKFQAIKGVRDILPPESALWNRVEQTAREVFATYGYGEIRLPIFEQTELFARSIGVETDVVSKEMYTFEDYEFSNLVQLRNATITWDSPNGSTAEFQNFHELAARFLAEAKQVFEDGGIPKTPDNKLTLENLGNARVLLQSVLNQARQDVFPRIAAVKEEVRKLRFGDSLTLRPEATASVCRAYIQNGMYTWPGIVKLYYIGPMFRREQPQKGRYRQFYQIGAEAFSRPGHVDSEAELKRDAAIDAEVIEMLLQFFDHCGLLNYETNINSIGCKECRLKYVAELKDALEKSRAKLSPDSQRRIGTNPLRVLDSKAPEDQLVIETLPRITDHLCLDCQQHYLELKRLLEMRGIKFQENWRLVRGLDYYTRTTFEITAPGLGAQNAVCGGGRYDGLMELLGGPPTKGIGFAIGTDRLILAIQAVQAEGVLVDQALIGLDVLVTGTTLPTWERATTLASLLREKGLRVYLPEPGTRVKKAMELAHKVGIRVALIVGEDELKEGRLTIRILSPFEEGQPRDGSLQNLDKEAIAYGRLVKLRAQLERYLKELGSPEVSFHSGVGLRAILSDLRGRGILPEKLAYELEQFSSMLNAAVHGQALTYGSLESAVVTGNLLLAEIENLLETSKNQ